MWLKMKKNWLMSATKVPRLTQVQGLDNNGALGGT